MKGYKWLIVSLVIFFSGVAIIPVIAFPWTKKINWQSFSAAYKEWLVYLPVILK